MDTKQVIFGRGEEEETVYRYYTLLSAPPTAAVERVDGLDFPRPNMTVVFQSATVASQPRWWARGRQRVHVLRRGKEGE